MSAFSTSSRTSCVRRNVFEISPGQVPSLRAEPQITSTRERLAGSAQVARALSMRSFASIQSSDRS